jgi:hypothetical protein
MSDELSEEQLAEIGARGAREAIEAARTAQAKAQYGDSVGAGGGSPSRPTQRSTSQEAEDFIHDRLKKGDGLGDSAGKRAFALWVGPRIADAAEASINHSSYRSFSRQSPDDKKITDDRKRATGPLARH